MAIYQREHPAVLRFLARRTAPEHAPDLAHDAFLIAWRRLDDIPTSQPDARAWLFTVARNCLLNDRRSTARRGALSIRLAAAGEPSIPAADNDVIARVDLARAWGSLSPTQQEVIALSVWDELTSPQAGRVLGISSAAYRLRLHRARATLQLALDHTSPEPSRLSVSAHRPVKESS
jgi:RNA polymerase sigma-70 factor (ECF subfamily)